MEMSPQQVRSAAFKTVRKGADPDEVATFLQAVADELERAQNQSTAMEARARAAVVRLQELSESPASPADSSAPAAPAASVDESETISRTLLLAQRTADSLVAEARAEAARITQNANDEAASALDAARDMSTRLADEARVQARQAGDAERATVLSEVEALKARRDFLESDVEQLEIFIADQRARIRESAAALVEVTERVPGGLAEVRAPLLSASDDTGAVDVVDGEQPAAPTDEAVTSAEAEELVIVTEIAEQQTEAPSDSPADSQSPTTAWDGGEADGAGVDDGDATQAMEQLPQQDEPDDFRFTFDERS